MPWRACAGPGCVPARFSGESSGPGGARGNGGGVRRPHLVGTPAAARRPDDRRRRGARPAGQGVVRPTTAGRAPAAGRCDRRGPFDFGEDTTHDDVGGIMNRIVRALVAAACGLLLALAGMTGSAGATSARSATPEHHHSGQCRGWMALTFDAGPSYSRTRTLRTLRAARVPAPFFDVGMRVAANSQLSAFEAREGHLVLNHTWSHPHLPALTP